MRSFYLTFFFCLSGLVALPATALTTNLYEKDTPQIESFTAKVRVVRDISDDVEVFFESDQAKGAYTLPRSFPDYAAQLKILEESKKAKGPAVTITAEKESKVIKSIQKSQQQKAPDLLKQFDQMFGK